MQKKNQGITLIALIVTIIVLLILAGISIGTLIGENGILNKATKAKEKMKKAEYLEELQVIGLGLQPDRTTKKWDNPTYMNQYQYEIKRDDMFLNAKEIKQLPDAEEITIQVITVEGLVYWVTEEKVEYKGTEEDLEPIEPEEPVVEPTGIWPTLEGNTLKFYTTEEKARNSSGKMYENVQGKTFIRDANTETVDTPWFSDKEQITAVEFVDEVAPEYLGYYFSDLSLLETVNMEKIKTINVSNMQGMFLNCRNLKEVATGSFDTRNVEDMSWMFLNCSSLTNLNVSSFNTKKVTDMSVMFNGCSSLTQLDITSFDTSNVTNMRSMFANCTALAELDVSNFNTEKVTNMATMFYGCTNLEKLDLSNFDTTNVVDMNFMFCGCTEMTSINVSSFNTVNVTDMHFMFQTMKNLKTLDISNFDTKKVTNMEEMFAGSSSLTTIYVGANWKLASNVLGMFWSAGTSTTTLKK